MTKMGTVVLLVATAVCTSIAVSAADARRVLEARRAGIGVEMPTGWSLSERPLRVMGDELRSVVLVRVYSTTSEPPLSETADLEIAVHSLSPRMSPAAWVEREHRVSGGLAGELRPAMIARLPALAREVRSEARGPLVQVFLAVEGRGLVITVHPRPGQERAVQHALETLQLWQDVTLAPTAHASQARAAGTSTLSGTVGLVLLVPADVSTRPDHRLVLMKALQHLQIWFQRELGDGLSFRLGDLQIVKSTREASWFAKNPAGSDSTSWFYRNVTADAAEAAGIRYDDPAAVSLVYVDADEDCGQAGGAAGGRVAIISRNDLRGLTSQAFQPRCVDQAPSKPRVGRWIGGAGVLLSWLLGLTSPQACVDDDPATICPNALTGPGFQNYPDTVLLPEDKAVLRESPFITQLNLARPLYDCSKLFAAPR